MTILESPSRLFVRPWLEPVPPPTFCPTSHYVEYCWLPVLGPSTSWLYRHLGLTVAAHPKGVLIDLLDLALDHGLGHSTGRHGALARSLGRLVRFGAATTEDDMLLVRPGLPALPAGQLLRLTPQLQLTEAHLRVRPDCGP